MFCKQQASAQYYQTVMSIGNFEANNTKKHSPANHDKLKANDLVHQVFHSIYIIHHETTDNIF
jgi:hypothetical protein